MKTMRVAFVIAALMSAGATWAGVKTEEDWKVVNGKQSKYLNAKEKEVVLQGTLIAEYYGKPGVNYFRAPYRYWLKTKKQKLALGPNDGVYLRLNKKTVEAKGKLLKEKNGTTRMFVGWIRVVKAAKQPTSK